jgi:hypothetical protein
MVLSDDLSEQLALREGQSVFSERYWVVGAVDLPVG